MVTSDFSPEVEIGPFRVCAMHPAIIIGTVRSLWTWLWGRYHVPQNAFLVLTNKIASSPSSVQHDVNSVCTRFSILSPALNLNTCKDASHTSWLKLSVSACVGDVVTMLLLTLELHSLLLSGSRRVRIETKSTSNQ